MRAVLAAPFALCASPAWASATEGGADATSAVPFLALGFVIGLAHALDADHVAAVAAMIGRGDGRRGVIARGAAWGLGHTLALFLICSGVVLLGLSISERLSATMELAVGVMIVGLGMRVLWKLWRERIHIHAHEHAGMRHVHVHSHKGDAAAHGKSSHHHRHPVRAHAPTLAVGLLHGAAGSAGLLVLVVASAEGATQAMVAFALFGLGSLIGMTCLTAAASYPLDYVHRGAPWMRKSLALATGGLALAVGGGVALDSLQTLGAAGL